MINKQDVKDLFKSMGANIPEIKDPEAEANEQRKELKKLWDSYVAVAEHMLGRPATIDEMVGILKEANGTPDQQVDNQPSQTDLAQKPVAKPTVFSHDQTPLTKTASTGSEGLSILNTNVYFGRDKNKQPDPKSVLFYEHPDGSVYNAASSKWEDVRPHVLDHLDSRPVMNNEFDINNYILHGLMEPAEFEALGHMLPENCHKMWGLKKKIEDAQALLNDESQVQADGHGKVMEMEHDLRELLDAVRHLQADREAMLAVLSEHGLDSQFMSSEDVDISPELQMEHEMSRRRIAANDLVEGEKKDSEGDAGGIESVSPTDAAQLPGVSSTIGAGEDLGKSEDLEKGRGRITMPNLEPKMTRPDQQVKPVDTSSESYKNGTNIAQRKFNKVYPGVSGAAVDDRNIGLHIGPIDANKAGVTPQSFGIAGNKEVAEHEGHHNLVDHLIQNHGFDKIHNHYNSLINTLDPRVHNLLTDTLKRDKNYNNMANSPRPRHQLAFQEEKINLLRDFIHPTKMRDSLKAWHNDPKFATDYGFTDQRDMDNALKLHWNKLRSKASKTKIEDL